MNISRLKRRIEGLRRLAREKGYCDEWLEKNIARVTADYEATVRALGGKGSLSENPENKPDPGFRDGWSN